MSLLTPGKTSPLYSDRDGTPMIAADTHVHFYPGADAGRALTAGYDNLAAGAKRAGHQPATFALFLTETAQDAAFDAMASGSFAPDGWDMRHDAGRAALRAMCVVTGAALLILAGRQIKTKEGIEVLALATTQRFADGRPVRDLLRDLHARRIPAVLPWGLGKWAGARGALVETLLAEAESGGLMLGDNAGRPWIWRTPPLFLSASARQIPVLPGSDPLPVPGAESGIGRFGCLLDGAPDPDRPARALREKLFCLRGQPAAIGERRGLRRVIAEQTALRSRKGRARYEAAAHETRP